jgi:hypothetical protein
MTSEIPKKDRRQKNAVLAALSGRLGGQNDSASGPAMAGRAKAQVTEVPGSHAIYVSKPDEVAEVFQQATYASI